MASKLQKAVSELRRQGKRPVIQVAPETQVPLPPSHRGPGRPRVRDPHDPLSNHVGRRGKHWPHCMVYGCKKLLKVTQRAVCSEECGAKLFNQCLETLYRLGVRKQELLDAYEEPAFLQKSS